MDKMNIVFKPNIRNPEDYRGCSNNALITHIQDDIQDDTRYDTQGDTLYDIQGDIRDDIQGDIQGNNQGDTQGDIQDGTGQMSEIENTTRSVFACGGVDRCAPPRHPGLEDYFIRQQSVTSRLETYRSWQIPEIQDPKDLAEAGFYFTGSRDIVQCFSCEIRLAEWEDSDDPWVEHARYSPSCEYLHQKRGEEYINSVQTEWEKVYNLEFNAIQARLESYQCWDYRSIQRPDVLADAGFFYTGEMDEVKCFYCGGVLKEWNPDDKPWTDHARMFPHCRFLRHSKGLEFIQNVAKSDKNDVLRSVDVREENTYLSVQHESNSTREPRSTPTVATPRSMDSFIRLSDHFDSMETEAGIHRVTYPNDSDNQEENRVFALFQSQWNKSDI